MLLWVNDLTVQRFNAMKYSSLQILARFNLAEHLVGLLKADDPADRPAFSSHVDDLDRCAFHVMKHRSDARREVAICDKCRCRYHEPSCRGQQDLVHAFRKLSHCRLTPA